MSSDTGEANARARAPVPGEVGPVVVGTDFSEPAAAALAEARYLAARLGVTVAVVHVVDGAPVADWREGGRADEWLRAVDLDVNGLVVRFGSPWVELARLAEEMSPVLLVVGSHGVSGYQPLAIGTTASRVSMQARCPVVLVSPKASRATGRVEPVWGRADEGADAPAGARLAPGEQ